VPKLSGRQTGESSVFLSSMSSTSMLGKVSPVGAGPRDDQRLCGMAVVLANARRIEFNPDFDAAQLRRAVESLEGF
jgi:hypothetical protein